MQWFVGTARALECDLPPARISEGMLRRLGQDLFAPPNVKGWDGGIAWITTNTLLDRDNMAAMLVKGRYVPQRRLESRSHMARMGDKHAEHRPKRLHVGGVNLDKILTLEERADKNRLVAALQHRLLQSALKADQKKALQDFLDAHPRLNRQEILAAIRLIMCTPEYQVT